MQAFLRFLGTFLNIIALFSLAGLVIVLLATPFGLDSGIEDFNEVGVAVIVYLVIALAFGGLGLASWKAGQAEITERIPLVRDVPAWSLAIIGTIAAIPILLFVALVVSIITSGGLD
jgi:hypothetical protein